jgi:hypothetical protein
MKNELPTHKYKVHLPVAVWAPNQGHADGVTNYMSNHDIAFSLDTSLAIELGTSIMLLVSLPSEITTGSQVHLRACGQVVRLEPNSEANTGPTFIAAMDWYDFVRGDASTVLRSSQAQTRAANS